MRVLQISHRHHVVGGSDAVFMATCALLENAGHQVIPFCLSSPRNLPSPWSGYFPAGADTGQARGRDSLRYFFNREARQKLNALLDAAGPIDVAHLHIYHGKQTPAILPVLRARGIPIVHSLHEYKLACPVYTMQRGPEPCELCVGGSTLNCLRHRCKDGSVLRSLVMTAEMATSRLLGDVRLVDRFICVSDFQRRLMQRAGIEAAKLVKLHNFVDLPDVSATTDSDGYLLYAGRIEELKGIATLIDAVEQCGHRLLVAGDGGYVAQMQSRIAGMANVSYVGFQTGDALRRLIRRARAVVVPSQWYENCPMSVLEAKALARPVIGARIGGIPELIRDRRDGFLFEPGNTDALIAAIAALDAAEPLELSRNALQDAAARFSSARYLGSLLSYYRKSASGRSRAQPALV
jgi:glycosyltransferase involved in cell wall biosynthesis